MRGYVGLTASSIVIAEHVRECREDRIRGEGLRPGGPFFLGPVGDVHGHEAPPVERRPAIPIRAGDHDASVDYHVRPDSIRRVRYIGHARPPCRGNARAHGIAERGGGFGRQKVGMVDGHLERFELEFRPGGEAAPPSVMVVEAAPRDTVKIPVAGRVSFVK